MSTIQQALEQESAAYENPIQVFDTARIRQNITGLGQSLAGTKDVLFAVKSFPATEVLTQVRETGAGFEVSSVSEYELLPQDLCDRVVSLNAPAADHLSAYLTRGNQLHVHLNSARRLADITESDDRLSFGLRLSHTALGLAAGSIAAGEPSRFGATRQEFAESATLFRDGRLTGVHLHNGSEVNTPVYYLAALEAVLELAEEHKIPFRFINLGGGLHPIETGSIHKLLSQLHNRGQGVPILIEPGHVTCRDAGFLLCKTRDVRSIEGDRFHVTLDTSYECHSKWSVPIWQPPEGLEVLRLPHNKTPAPEEGFQFLLFSGSSCYERDLMGVYRLPKSEKLPIRVGEVLTFSNLNGYSYAWNTSFNGVPKAKVRFA